MRPLPPGLPPDIATHTIKVQESLAQQEALRRLGLNQQNGVPRQFHLEKPALMPVPNVGLNRMAAAIGGLRIAFVMVRLVVVAAVLWIMWHIFAPY